MALDRRSFLLSLAAVTGTTALGIPALAQMPVKPKQSGSSEPFQLPPLPYDYDALQPYIDAETMRFHHDKHHATYVKNLNTALEPYPELKSLSAVELLRNLNSLPEAVRVTVRDNGGGHVNHTMFWEIMSPDGGGEPTGALNTAINDTFGSFAAFKTQFNEAGSKRFGSGWAWLVRDRDGKLKVTSTPNQDSSLMAGMLPILGNDVWEHAYYLNYRNDRAEYLKQWWNVVNWREVNQRFEQAMP